MRRENPKFVIVVFLKQEILEKDEGIAISQPFWECGSINLFQVVYYWWINKHKIWLSMEEIIIL